MPNRRFMWTAVLTAALTIVLAGRAVTGTGSIDKVAAAGFTTSATAAPAMAVAGAAVSVGASVKSDATITVLVDTEVFNASGAKVFQNWADNVALTAGQARIVSSVWNVPAGQPAGRYTVKIGVFAPGWGPLYHWDDRAGEIPVEFVAISPTPPLTASPSPTPTPTRTPAPVVTATPAPALPAGPLVVIYGDALAAGWADWSWGSSINPAATAPVATGARSLAFTAASGWAGLYLHTDTAVAAAEGGVLQFAAHASRAGQRYGVLVYDANGYALKAAVPLASYGGEPVAGAWKTYRIPLADLGATGRQIKGVVIQETSGGAQPALYLDDLVITAVSVNATPTATPAPIASSTPTPAPSAGKFTTLSPGSVLPSGAECALRVRRSSWEPRPGNATENNTKPAAAEIAALQPWGPNSNGVDARADALRLRIDGQFTGTTDELIQWGACKWGLDEDIVRAVAVQESWWRQQTQGDFNSATNEYDSYGLLQVRRTAHTVTFPVSKNSTPFNVDFALAVRRACFEGHINWLNQVQPGAGYAAGDEWGCVGFWFSGRWKDAGAIGYIAEVQRHLAGKTWLKPGF